MNKLYFSTMCKSYYHPDRGKRLKNWYFTCLSLSTLARDMLINLKIAFCFFIQYTYMHVKMVRDTCLWVFFLLIIFDWYRFIIIKREKYEGINEMWRSLLITNIILGDFEQSYKRKLYFWWNVLNIKILLLIIIVILIDFIDKTLCIWKSNAHKKKSFSPFYLY